MRVMVFPHPAYYENQTTQRLRQEALTASRPKPKINLSALTTNNQFLILRSRGKSNKRADGIGSVLRCSRRGPPGLAIKTHFKAERSLILKKL